jgi:hypothetical protein
MLGDSRPVMREYECPPPARVQADCLDRRRSLHYCPVHRIRMVPAEKAER